MTKETKTITRSTYLQALGLFTLATTHMRRVDESREELMRLLGIEDNGHIDDEIYSPQHGFDKALDLEGVKVEPETKP